MDNFRSEIELGVSEFVALFNQTIEYAYPNLIIVGELANLRISKNKWVYFDLKDENATVKFFGTIYQLPGPLEDGMILKVRGQPRLHNLYGFSVNVQTITPAGEGSIRRAADLLAEKLVKEGLFDESRKRPIDYPPSRVGLITSRQSAAYADFIKVLNARWRGVDIELIDVQVQGEIAPSQIVAAIDQFNSHATPVDVLVLIRGGGSAEDLAAFSTEHVTRSVAGSRIPTVVAIGHDIDISLAERAADLHASTPSNAAELLVPDRKTVLDELKRVRNVLQELSEHRLYINVQILQEEKEQMHAILEDMFTRKAQSLQNATQLFAVLNPAAILRRGYAVIRYSGSVIRDTKNLSTGAMIEVQLSRGEFEAKVAKLGKVQ